MEPVELKLCPAPWDHDGAYLEIAQMFLGPFRVQCDHCGCKGPIGQTAEDAARLWNTRPDEDRLRARIAELESLQGDIKTASDVLQDYDGDTIWQQAQAAVARIEELESELDGFIHGGM